MEWGGDWYCAQAAGPEDYAWPQMNSEGDDDASQNDDNDDITAELRRLSSEGLPVIEHACLLAESLRTQLAYVHTTFRRFAVHQRHSPDDDLELHAATALRQVDELLRQQQAREAQPLPALAVNMLKRVQRCAQDAAVLANSRWIDQRIMRRQKIPSELALRLERSFGVAASDDDLWTRLGNSKYNVFTKGRQFGSKRESRRCRGGKREGKAAGTGTYTLQNLSEPIRIPLADLLETREDSKVGTTHSDIGRACQEGAHASTEAPDAAASSSAASFSAGAARWLDPPPGVGTDYFSHGVAAKFERELLGSGGELARPSQGSGTDELSHCTEAKFERVLQKHGVVYSKAIIVDLAGIVG